MYFQQGAILLHGSAAAIMAYGYNSLGSLAIDTWIKSQTGGHFQFLTIQGCVKHLLVEICPLNLIRFESLSVAWLTMVMSLAADLFPSSVGGYLLPICTYTMP